MSFNHGFIDFFNQLNKNNNRNWFKENRKWYELAVREPFKDLIDELIPEVEKLDKGINMESKDALFRVNRDLRFSHDKPPYKTHMAAGFSRGGRKSHYAGFFLQIGMKHIMIGGGLPFIEKDILRKVRIQIGYNNMEFQRIINAPEFKSVYGQILGENDKDLPKSFMEIHEEIPLIANKQFYYGTFCKTENWLFKDEFKNHIIDHFKAGINLNRFLINAIDDFSNGPALRITNKALLYSSSKKPIKVQ